MKVKSVSGVCRGIKWNHKGNAVDELIKRENQSAESKRLKYRVIVLCTAGLG